MPFLRNVSLRIFLMNRADIFFRQLARYRLTASTVPSLRTEQHVLYTDSKVAR